MLKDPFSQFAAWFGAAKRHKAIDDATAMCLSTIDMKSYPDGRMVLLKEVDRRGFVFYTNLNSVKGKSLKRNAKAALAFYWAPLSRQVRILGRTELVTSVEADAYWETRPRLSQLGAWASKQSDVLSSRSILLKAVAQLVKKYRTGPIPRPPYWTGVRVIPRKIEFWQGRPNRLHDRVLYAKTPRGWAITRLYP